MPTLWNAEERFREAYLADYPGYFKTADAGFIDDAGYIFVMSRTDDIINVAGHRLSTGAMEEVLAQHPAVAECAVIGVADALKGQVPVGLVCLKSGVVTSAVQIVQECVQLVRQQIGPVAAFKKAVVVPRLPKTRSGKILRGTMQKIADSESYKVSATIDDRRSGDPVRGGGGAREYRVGGPLLLTLSRQRRSSNRSHRIGVPSTCRTSVLPGMPVSEAGEDGLRA